MDFQAIHQITKILIEDAEVVREKTRLYHALGLPLGELVDLKIKISRNESSSYDFFHEMLHKWISISGGNATLSNLLKCLKDEEFLGVANKLESNVHLFSNAAANLCFNPSLTIEEKQFVIKYPWKEYLQGEDKPPYFKETEGNLGWSLGFNGKFKLQIVPDFETDLLEVFTSVKDDENFFFHQTLCDGLFGMFSFHTSIMKNLRRIRFYIKGCAKISAFMDLMVANDQETAEFSFKVSIFKENHPIYKNAFHDLGSKCTKLVIWNIKQEELLNEGTTAIDAAIGQGFKLNDPPILKFTLERNSNGNCNFGWRVCENDWWQVFIQFEITIKCNGNEIAHMNQELHDVSSAVRIFPNFIKDEFIPREIDGNTELIADIKLTLYGRESTLAQLAI